MKTKILSMAIALLSVTSIANGQVFQQKMGEALQQFAQCQSINDYQKSANQFKMIANAEEKEWLPLYYHAHAYIMMSFMSQEGAEQKDVLLDEAEISIGKMMTLVPNEVEAITLKAFYYTAKLVIDPMNRGREMSVLFQQNIGRALAMDSENPRAKYMKLANDVGSASFFGKDPKEYKTEVEQLLAEWDNFKPKSAIHPSWGKAQVAGLLKQINN